MYVLVEARKRGDFESAKNLCEELNSLSLLRFDPTNPEGAGGEWDVRTVILTIVVVEVVGVVVVRIAHISFFVYCM